MPFQDIINGGIGIVFMVKGAIDDRRRHREVAAAARELAERVPATLATAEPPEVINETSTLPTAETENAPEIEALATPRPDYPTTQETVTELKRRLGKELYRIELDLIAGCKIMGKPCDCCHDKHHFGIEATAEELIPMDRNPAYRELIAWYNDHLPYFTTEASAGGEYDDQYPLWAGEIRVFLKRVMGTGGTREMLTEEDKAEIEAR